MMAVRGILAGYPTKDAAYFADVDFAHGPAVVARFVRGACIGGLRDAPGRSKASTRGVRADQETGRQACTARTCSPPETLRNWITRETERQVQPVQRKSRILRFLGFSSKRSTTEYASAADSDAVRQWHGRRRRPRYCVGQKGADLRSWHAQDESIFLRTLDERKEAVVARRGSSDC